MRHRIVSVSDTDQTRIKLELFSAEVPLVCEQMVRRAVVFQQIKLKEYLWLGSVVQRFAHPLYRNGENLCYDSG